jgi:hypothetical protein
MVAFGLAVVLVVQLIVLFFLLRQHQLYGDTLLAWMQLCVEELQLRVAVLAPLVLPLHAMSY